MQKDEIWELSPGEDDKKGPGGGESGPAGEDKNSEDASASSSGDSSAEKKPKKEPDRLDMDEILDLKPDSEQPAQETDGEKPSQGGVSEEGDAGKKDSLELVDIGEKKPRAAEDEEGVVVARQEEKSIHIEKPQVLDPGEESKEKGKPAELQTAEFKKYERAPRVQGGAPLPQKSGLLTIGLAVVFVFLAASTAALVLPFFGIEALPDELPVVGQLMDFYRNLPIFPD